MLFLWTGNGMFYGCNIQLDSANAKGQDNNLLACRFYAKCGFVIGGVNTMLYRNFDNDEFAVFWYLPF